MNFIAFPCSVKSPAAPQPEGNGMLGRETSCTAPTLLDDKVRMMRNRGQRMVGQVADDLGVAPHQLHRWSKAFDSEAVAKRNLHGETLEDKVIQLMEPYTRDLGLMVPIFDREIVDVDPAASLSALYQRLQFTGTAHPDGFLPRS